MKSALRFIVTTACVVAWTASAGCGTPDERGSIGATPAEDVARTQQADTICELDCPNGAIFNCPPTQQCILNAPNTITCGSVTSSCCPTGQVVCGGACTDTRSDPNNCGSCGHSCGGQACSNGVCPCTATVNCAGTEPNVVSCTGTGTACAHALSVGTQPDGTNLCLVCPTDTSCDSLGVGCAPFPGLTNKICGAVQCNGSVHYCPPLPGALECF